MTSVLLSLILPTLAAPAERPHLPFHGVAAEDGAHTYWVNPALMNFDRDASWGLYYDRGAGDVTDDVALVSTAGGFGTTVAHRSVGEQGWWTLGTGLSLRADDGFTLGATVNWQIPQGQEENFTTWDLGAAWRPTSWFGLAGVAQNVGGPRQLQGIERAWGLGTALRPRGDSLTLGLDWRASEAYQTPVAHSVEASVRSRVARGTWARIWGRQGVSDTDDRTVGISLELRAGEVGYGAQGTASSGDSTAFGGGGWIASAPEQDSLLRPTDEVASFDLDGAYPYQPVPSLFSDGGESYLTLLRRLQDAARDPGLQGMLLTLDQAPGSLAQIEELRGAVAAAREAGKPVVAYLRGDAGNGAYYLAAACDKVFLHPAATLDVIGLASEQQYLRGTLELVGVGAQYAKRGQYKSAPEQFTETQSTDPARAQMDALLDDLYGRIIDGIATGRGKKTEDVRTLIDNAPFTASEALAQGLVDGLVYPDALDEKLGDVFPKGWERDEEYAAAPDQSGWRTPRAIAVVVIEGVIASGESSAGGLLSGAATGSATIVRALEATRTDDSVKAVVLRVDSPGGSAFASDEIWRAVERVKDAGKPVIVSMGGYAASGGYYVSAGADAIYALPSTVTGSIGIYGGKFNAKGLFERLDITTESHLRGRNAGMYSMARPFDDREYAALDRLIAEGYRQFKDKVETGREMAPERVEELAQGHVWSGLAAKGNGLVDEQGGFLEAVERARVEANLPAGGDWSLLVLDPWGSSESGVPARVIRSLQPSIALPEPLREAASLATLRGEHTFALLPWRVDPQ